MPDVKEILEGLRSDDNEVLREAAFQAGELDLKDAVPLLVGLLETSNIGVQEAADNALRRIAGPEAVQSVIPLLRSENAPSRNMAMDILRVIGCDDLHAVFGLMRDEDPDIRIFAADILGTTANSLAVNPLCNALLKDPEVNVRYQAAVSLGVLAMPEAAKCLNLAMGDEEWVQYAVIEALAKIKHSSSVDALVKGMDRSSDLVASMIIDALAEIGNVKAVAMLMRRIPDSPTALANKIVKAVVGILGGKALTMLSDHDRETLRLAMLKAVEDEDEEVQDAAIQGLAYLGGERASKAIIGIAAGIDRDLNQERLDEIVGHLANIGLTEAIRSDLDSADAARAEVAVEAMGRMTDPAVPRLLMDAFWDKDLNLQRRMAWVLSKLAGPEAVDFFLDLFARHTDGKVLKSAVKYCSEHKVQQSLDSMFALLEHKYDDVKEAALEGCVTLGGPEVTARFLDSAQSRDPMQRLMAIYAIGKLDARANIQTIKQALGDEVPDIRKIALEALAGACEDDRESRELLIAGLEDENSEVRCAVVEQLGECCSGDVVPHLLRALEDGDDWVKIRAVEALGARRDPQAVAHLAPLLHKSNRLIVLKVLESLGEIGGSAAFQTLIDISNCDEPELVRAAEAAMERIQEEQGSGG